MNYSRVYDEVYAKSNYTPHNGEHFWRFVGKRLMGTGHRPRRVLDIGCGLCGGLTWANRALRPDVAVGLDVALSALKKSPRRRIKAVAGSALELPLRSNYFDLVLCGDVLEHIEKDDVSFVISEAHRVTMPFKYCSFLICLEEERQPLAGYKLHITLEPVDWWVNQVKEAGFTILEYVLQVDHLLLTATKERR